MSNKIGFIFPGQGSQFVGMGKNIVEKFPESNTIFEKSKQILNYDLKKLCFEGPVEKLNNTRYTQPAIFTISYIIFSYLKSNNIYPAMTAGHSLGEYSALCAAGSFSFEEGLYLVHKRGQLMDSAVPEGEGSMAAIIGLEKNIILDFCNEVNGILEIANINCPGQIIISGDKKALKTGMEIAKNRGARKVIELNVSGPFHSSLMEPVQKKLNEEINNIKIKSPEIPVIANVSAKFINNKEQVKKELLTQLTGTVCWEESMELMINKNINIFVETGPGKVLKGLMRRINRKVKVFGTKNPDEIIEELGVKK